MYHLSPIGGATEEWVPYSTTNNSTGPLSEPDIPRISYSPDINRCFLAVYANYNHLFEVDKETHLDFFVYKPLITKATIIVSNADIIKAKHVWDAIVTGESWVTSPVIMQACGKVRIFNCTENTEVYAYPYNDKRRKRLFVGHRIDYEWLDVT